ncbi:unnamed protein product [Callosobruchus maculatus]|uniref:Uncharacterized protein n=1 Tax=Callosobruchus maculatus TaxID=64391 RepID=A0A653BIC6_CALMS|nr:unnamed protein product [Callosobruchus maculatus]
MAPIKKKIDRQEQVKQNMRKMRAKIKSDPEKYEEYKRKERERYKKRKAEGKIQKISDLPERQQRAKRKIWRASAKKYRDSRRRIQDFLVADSPPPSPSSIEPDNLNLTPNRQLLQGQKRSRNHRRKLNKTIKSLQERNKLLEKKVKKYKSKVSRLKKKAIDPNSPGKKVDLLLKDQLNNSHEIKRRILWSEVLTKQVKENLVHEKSMEGKRRVLQAISGKVVKKYKFHNVLNSISRRLHGSKKHFSKKKNDNRELKQIIIKFFERDDCSRLMPGKKDTITKAKRKIQKRVLCDSLINIHKKFIAAFPKYIKLSYSEFCKNRPFWVLIPNARDRETCACKQCENITLITRKLRTLDIIQVTFPDQLCKELCCDDVLGEDCLSRKCKHCKDKQVLFNISQPEERIRYNLWQSKKIKVNIKGEEKDCQKTVKEVVESTVRELVIKFVNDLPKYMTHLLNRIHQYNTIDKLKKKLKDSEVLIHMDFSENYNCKYGREIQSAHFGASKPQISLHTVVVYVSTSINGDPPRNINFCTISENLRHDPSAICGHLTPILREIKSQIPQIKTAYFQSDGPTTQYKNKKMFYLIASYIADILDVNQIQWHYSESGHGKGAPDGIGGSVKRKADESVARGKDVSCFKEFHDILREECKKTKIIAIGDEEIIKYDSLVPANLKPFKGTLRIRQIFWSRSNRHSLFFRYLSCLECQGMCEHYHLGEIHFKGNKESSNEHENLASKRIRYSDVYSSDEEVIGEQKLSQAEGNFVVVQFSVKKGMKYFIGKVLHGKENEEYTISFMRRKTDTKFVFPIQEDIAKVPDHDIVLFLKSPYEKRGQYFFDVDQIGSIKNLV